MRTDIMFSSKTDLWKTPHNFFNELDAEFHFDIEVCGIFNEYESDGYPTDPDDFCSYGERRADNAENA